jgi:plastocyanin
MLLRLAGILGVWAVVGASGATAEAQTVAAQPSDTFSPAEVTITQGESVTFSNNGGRHNVRFDGETTANPSPASTSSWSFQRPFGTVGDFRFYCEVHGGPGGSGMSGIVHVIAAGAPPPGNPPPGGGPPQQEPGGGGSPTPGPGGPAPGGPQPGEQGSAVKVTFKVSDATPLAGRLVRLSGVVSPARDGRKLQIQRRLRNGRFKTIALTRLHAAKGDKSTYSLKLRLSKDAVLRARVAGDDAASRARKLDVHRAA